LRFIGDDLRDADADLAIGRRTGNEIGDRDRKRHELAVRNDQAFLREGLRERNAGEDAEH
jgi:hypothetical protein